MASTKSAISPTRAEDYPEWYQQVIKGADLAENSAVRGCMVIKPWGYSLWENMQKGLDRMFKETGHQNAYFPLFIPMSFLEKEAQHVEGFAKECAVVTHHRLEPDGKGGLRPAGPLEEPLIVRQFLWQEGHTVHATAEEAMEETRKMLDVYTDFAENHMAMPVIRGEKTPGERFPGAVTTLSIEAMMQDRKALQAGTSHFLGQNFSKAQEIKFQSQAGQIEYAWTTSWGVSTRLIGALIMTHSDDDGLVLPPRLAPTQVVLMPIYRDDAQKAEVMAYCTALRDRLAKQSYCNEAIRVEIDSRDMRGGEKKWYHVKRGVPIRVEVGPKDMANQAAFVARRDTNQSSSMPIEELVQNIGSQLESIQRDLFAKALAMREANTVDLASEADFRSFFQPDDEQGRSQGGGFAKCWFSSESEVQPLLDELKVTIRCIPLDAPKGPGKCFLTGKPADSQAIFAKSY